MKMLVMELAGAGIDRLLGDEGLASLRQLAAIGCFGRLEPSAPGEDFQQEAIRAQVIASGGQAVILQPEVGVAGQLDAARRALEAGGPDYLRLGIGPLAGEGADQGIAQVLALPDDDTVLLVLLGADPGASDGFILAAPGWNGPLGELHGVTLTDLAPTLLDAAGYRLSGGMQGRSLLAGLAPADGAHRLPDDEEALQRARLEGLGYIG